MERRSADRSILDDEELRQTPGDRLRLLAQSETYLAAAEAGTVPVEATRSWVLIGNAALPPQEVQP